MDILGVCLFIMTLFFLLGANLTIVKYFIIRWFYDYSNMDGWFPLTKAGIMIFLIYESCQILALVSYFRGSFSDPGFVPNDLVSPQEIVTATYFKLCEKCPSTWKPLRAHHCKICKRCVFRMDHHCDWFNNCVGIKNQKYFILFLLYTLMTAIMTLVFLLIGFYYYVSFSRGMATVMVSITLGQILALLFVVFAVFFIAFTFDFLKDQLQSIQDNQTTVETHQHLKGRTYNTLKQGMASVFGPNLFTWWFPVKPDFDANYLEFMYTENQLFMVFQRQMKFFEDSFHDQNHQLYNIIQKYQLADQRVQSKDD